MKVLGMHPNALQVDPKIVMQDKRFHAQSEAAEDAFVEMEEKEIADMHERFVVAHGGKIPKPEDIGVPKTAIERIQKESTFAQTKNLLKEGKTVAEIIKERGMVESTVWGHIEKLAADGEIELADLAHIEPNSNWAAVRRDLDAAMDKLGTERLKPLFEETAEKYSYDMIRLARIQYLLEGKGEVF
jgi:hypothetical protein